MGELDSNYNSWKREWRSSSKVPKLETGNRRVRAKFESWNRECSSSSQVRGLESEMKVFEPSSDAWNREWRSSIQVRGLESEMEEFEPSSNQVRGLESGMEDFKTSSEAWNREWKSSSQVRGLESGMEEFEPSSKVGIRKIGVFSKVPTLGIGNGRVRDKFEAWNQEWRNLSQVRSLESEMEVFEPSSDVVSWPHPSDIAVDPRLPYYSWEWAYPLRDLY